MTDAEKRINPLRSIWWTSGSAAGNLDSNLGSLLIEVSVNDWYWWRQGSICLGTGECHGHWMLD